MTVPLLIAGALVGALLFLRYLNQPALAPARYRDVYPARLPELLETLLRDARTGGFLILSIPALGEEGPFLQFKKLEAPDRSPVLASHFPNAPWARPYIERLLRALRDDGVHYSIEKLPSGSAAPELEFVVVEFGADVNAALAYAGLVLHRVFEIRPEQQVAAELWGPIAAPRVPVPGPETH